MAIRQFDVLVRVSVDDEREADIREQAKTANDIEDADTMGLYEVVTEMLMAEANSNIQYEGLPISARVLEIPPTPAKS